MAIAAGAEEQSQDPQLPAPTPEPADPLGIPFWFSLRAWHIKCV